MEQLKNEKWNIRAKAVEALKESKEASAVELLIEAINDKNYFVRLKAIEALAEIKDRKAIPPLIIVLNDNDFNINRAAIEALGEIGDIEALDPLLFEIKSDDCEIKWRVAEALGKIGSPRAVEALITALQDENSDVRGEAAYALGEIKDIRAIEPLINALKDESENVRSDAANALENIGNSEAAVKDNPVIYSLVKKLNDKDYLVREIAADILTKLKYEPANVFEKISVLIAKRNWSECEKMGKEAIPRLISMLNDKNTDTRVGAVEALGEIGLEALEPMINSVIRGEKSYYYEYAANDFFTKIGKPAVASLINKFKDTESKELVSVLSKIGQPAVEALINSLNNEDMNVRKGAIETLGEIGDSRAIDPLIDLVKDDNENFRFEAATALYKIKDNRAKDFLITRLNEKDLRVREIAAKLSGQTINTRMNDEERNAGHFSRINKKKELDNADKLDEQAKISFGNRKYEEAISYGKKALEIREKVLDSNHPDNHSKIVEYMMPFLSDNVTNTEEEELYIRAFVDISLSLNGLAHFYKAAGYYKEAEQLYVRALENNKIIFGEDNYQITTTYNDLALFYKDTGRYRDAESLFIRAMEIYENSFGKNSYDVADLASLYILSGRYEEAEPLLVRSLNIRENILGREHPDVAKVHNELALLYKDTGRYIEAESHFMRALKFWEKALDENDPVIAKTLNHLASLYNVTGRYKEAEPLLVRSLNIRENVLGREHPDVAASLNNLALLYRETGRYKEAEPLFLRALNICEKTFGPEHTEIAAILNNLAGLYYSTSRYTEAEPLFVRASKIMEKALGEGHPLTAKCFNNLALVYGAIEKHTLAHANFMTGMDIRRKNMDNIFSLLSEEQKISYFSAINFEMNYFLSHIAQHQSKDINAIRDGLDALLKWKGLVTESQSRYEELLSDTNNPDVTGDYKRLIEIKRNIVKLTFAGSGNKEYISILEEEKGKIEASMSTMSKPYALEKRIGQIDSKSIAKMLPKGSYLIEFACPEFYNFKDGKWEDAHYLAFILSSDEKIPAGLVDFGKADNINKLIGEYRIKVKEIAEEEENARKTDVSENRELRALKIEGVLKESQKRRNKTAQELCDKIFAPMKDYLGKGKNLFISPEGNLNFLPFEVLTSSEGKYLIDEYQFNYITAGRDIMRFTAENEPSENEMVIMADPDFDLGADKNNIVSAKLDLHLSREIRGINFGRLSGTRTEGETISNILKVKYGKEPKLYLGDQALEFVLMKNKNPKILHIASHGFFLTDEMIDIFTNSVSDNIRGLSGKKMRDLLIVGDKAAKSPQNTGNPMLRSGIALAGANTSIKSGREKGIVVAEKISGLKLRGTELVVLSACDTGVGEVKKGEGVFGLKRAFILAGAKTLVMSLWKVPDEETKDLMIEFYKNIADGKGKSEALREAKLKMKENHPNPFYWGGFISIGNPN